MNNTLESHKYFPYVAWALVVGFSLFTYFLTLRVSAEIATIDASMSDFETRLERLEQQAPQQ